MMSGWTVIVRSVPSKTSSAPVARSMVSSAGAFGAVTASLTSASAVFLADASTVFSVPMAIAATALTCSRLCGFFFCGMMLETLA